MPHHIAKGRCNCSRSLSVSLSLSLDGQADSVLCCPKCPVVLPHTPRAQQSLQHFIAQSQWRLRCAGADVDCDCNCDTWVQTSRLLPPDNALIALQRQPVGDQSSYCSGLGSDCSASPADTVLVQFFLFAAASWPERSHIPRQSRIELHFFLSALCPCCLTTCCDLLCFPLPLLLLLLLLLLFLILLLFCLSCCRVL